MSLESQKVHFNADERDLMGRILVDGLQLPSTALSRGGSQGHWWYVLRIALAMSLKLKERPNESFSRSGASKAEPRLEQVIGTHPGGDSLLPVFQAVLSAHQGEDLFQDEGRFVEVLQRHLRRGLMEVRAGWRPGNDFFDFLNKELLPAGASMHQRGGVETDAVLTVLQANDVSAELIERIEGPRLTVVDLKLASSGDLGRLRRLIDILPFELGLGYGAGFEIGDGQRRVSLFLPRPSQDWRPVKSALAFEALAGSDATLPVALGVTVDGKPVVFDLTEATHLFVAGQTGSGKSVCVHAIIQSLYHSENRPIFALIDPKEIEFRKYADLSGMDIFNGEVVTDAEKATELLQALVEEMDNRQSALAKSGAMNLAEARERGSELKHIVVVIDELADLIMTTERAFEYLIRLSQKARATGIHLVLATQRPDAETFPGLLRTNIPSRIGLAVRSSSDSRIILDEPGAEKLLGRGDMLLKITGKQTQRLHGFQFDA